MGKNITSKMGKWKQYHLPHDIEAAEKNSKKERGEGGLKIWGRKSSFKKIEAGKNT